MMHRTTTIVTHDGNGSLRFHYVAVHSVDGRTWASNRRDLGAYYRRQLDERDSCQEQFERIDTGEVYDVRY